MISRLTAGCTRNVTIGCLQATSPRLAWRQSSSAPCSSSSLAQHVLQTQWQTVGDESDPRARGMSDSRSCHDADPRLCVPEQVCQWRRWAMACASQCSYTLRRASPAGILTLLSPLASSPLEGCFCLQQRQQHVCDCHTLPLFPDCRWD